MVDSLKSCRSLSVEQPGEIGNQYSMISLICQDDLLKYPATANNGI